jgi:hypothetical protein
MFSIPGTKTSKCTLKHLGENINTMKKSTEVMSDTSKAFGLGVNAEGSKYCHVLSDYRRVLD